MTLTTDIEVKLVNNEKLLELVYKLRNDVFVKEMSVVTETDIDEDDSKAFHFIATQGPVNQALEAIGTCRLFYINDNVGCIGRVAIASSHRGRKIGGLLLKLAEQHAREVGMKQLRIDSLDDRKEFYSKLGYSPSGKVYIKENLPHIKMVMNLE